MCHYVDSNTITSIAALGGYQPHYIIHTSLVHCTTLASIDWACAIQITAAVSIASNQVYVATNGQI